MSSNTEKGSKTRMEQKYTLEEFINYLQENGLVIVNPLNIIRCAMDDHHCALLMNGFEKISKKQELFRDLAYMSVISELANAVDDPFCELRRTYEWIDEWGEEHCNDLHGSVGMLYDSVKAQKNRAEEGKTE